MAKHGHSSKRPSKRSSKKSRKEKHADPKTKAFSGPNRPGPLFPINPHGNKPIEVLIKRRERLNKFIALREREGSAYNKKVGAK